LGREHLLSINPKPLDEAARWIESQRALWNARLDALDDLLKDEDRTTASRQRKGRSR